MLKEYCIKYMEKRGLLKKEIMDFYLTFAHKSSTALKEFKNEHPDAIVFKVFVEYKKREVNE